VTIISKWERRGIRRQSLKSFCKFRAQYVEKKGEVEGR
jgi:hypothetical protein